MGRYCASTSREGARDIPKTGHNDPPGAGASSGQGGCGGSNGPPLATAEFVHDGIPAIYDLFAVTNHYGRMGFGHYTAYARRWNERNMDRETWALFDDSFDREGRRRRKRRGRRKGRGARERGRQSRDVHAVL